MADKVKSDRDKLRAELFSSNNQKAHMKSKPVKIMGIDIELRTPTLNQMGNVGDRIGDQFPDRKALVEQLIEYSYVPGSDDKVFEEGDRESMNNWPSGDWVSTVTVAIAELTGIDLEEALKELKKTN